MPPPPLAPAPRMSGPMRVRRAWWKALRRARGASAHGLIDTAVSRLSIASGWRDFVASAASPEALTLDVATAGANWADQAALLLRQHGVVVLRGMFPTDLVAAALADAQALLAPFEAARDAQMTADGELLGCIWQVGMDRVRKPEASEKPVVTLRPRGPAPEAGNIGATQVERIARERGLNGLAALLAAPIHARMDAVVARVFNYRLRTTDLLKKESVLATQTSHIDTLVNFYYAFLYLNDIPDPADGPYAYLPGSHRREDLLFRDTLINRVAGRVERDLPALEDRMMPLTGPAGTVIISCQRGVHRGLPQAPGRLRMVLMTNFY